MADDSGKRTASEAFEQGSDEATGEDPATLPAVIQLNSSSYPVARGVTVCFERGIGEDSDSFKNSWVESCEV